MFKGVSNNTSSAELQEATWQNLGRLIIQLPRPASETGETESTNVKPKPKILIDGETKYAERGSVPHPIKTVDLSALYVKQQIQNHVSNANSDNLISQDETKEQILTPLQKELFSVINNYQDLYYSERTHTNGEEIRFVYCLHAVNHILKTRTKIIHHNAKITKRGEAPEEFRDQGLVRPKVLILVPFKESALR